MGGGSIEASLKKIVEWRAQALSFNKYRFY